MKPKVHHIAAKRNSYNDGWISENEKFHIIIPELKNTFFGIGGADKGRREYMGPIENDIVFLFSRPAVISAHKGMSTQDDIERGSVTVKLGEFIEFNGRTFLVKDCGDHYNASLVEQRGRA